MAATIATSSALAAGLALYANSKLGLTTDVKSIKDQKRSVEQFQTHVSKQGPSISLYRLLELADPDADAIWFEGKTWNYRAMKAEADLLAIGLQELGVKDGDFVAVFMTNSPEMVFIVYALAKLGAIPALINSALRDDTLLHCIRLPMASLTISTPDLAPFAATAAKALSGTVRTVSLNLGSFRVVDTQSNDIIQFSFPIAKTSINIPTKPKTLASTVALIYTSGTTGKPKACNIKNNLVMVVSCPAIADLDSPQKYYPIRTYSCMPIFHGTTFFTGVCHSVGTSGCFCISRRFSARNFWKEVCMSKATRILYVGELCRFLLATPETPYDRKHSVQVASGNGLQEDVWIAFQKRFNVPEIREYYRSTEGLVKYDNRHFGGKKGAGRVAYQGPLYRRKEKDQFILKFDYDSDMPYRDPKTGFCVPARLNEPGEAVARIRNMAVYPDYHSNPAATEAKFLRDVFEKGDCFQRSGDLLMQENTNWVRFVDRIGDTFRWKGENVSAGEIRAFISELPEVKDVVIVGKKLKGYDGQAGAAAINLGPTATQKDQEQFMAQLYQNLKRKGVPSYAFPRLVTVTNENVAVSAMFKQAKQVFKAFVWGPDSKNYWLDNNKYVPLNKESWARIEGGLAKL